MYKLFKNKTKHHNFCYAFLVFSSVLFAVKTYLIEITNLFTLVLDFDFSVSVIGIQKVFQ